MATSTNVIVNNLLNYTCAQRSRMALLETKLKFIIISISSNISQDNPLKYFSINITQSNSSIIIFIN